MFHTSAKWSKRSNVADWLKKTSERYTTLCILQFRVAMDPLGATAPSGQNDGKQVGRQADVFGSFEIRGLFKKEPAAFGE